LRTAYLLAAGGGHSITRHSMQEHLDGEIYAGRYIVADVKLRLPCPPERGRVIVGRAGFVLASPLPEDRWLFLLIVMRPIGGLIRRLQLILEHCLTPGLGRTWD
jgi:2-polyprenyl-6-methoxyphenol hydroxylase-like FAD-dependent oxidoreductase